MRCEKCDCDVPDKKILQHWRDFHEGEEDFKVVCPECGSVFHTRPNYQKHWYSKHYVRKEDNQSQHIKKPRLEESASIVGDADHSDYEVVPEKCAAAVDKNSVGNVESVCKVTVVQGSTVSQGSNSEDLQISAAPILNQEDSDLQSECSSESESDDSDSGVPLSELLARATAESKPCKKIEANAAAASFLLNVRDACTVPDNRVVDILSEAENLVKSAVHKFSNTVQEKLKVKGISLEDVMNVEESIEESSDVFVNIKSIKTQNNYFKENLNLVIPERIPMGRKLKKVRRRGNIGMKVVGVADELIFVPLKLVVDRLLNHPDYKQFAEEEKYSQDSPYLDSYMKGHMSEKNSVLQEHPNALRFILYYDDLEACSPLKSKAGKHKIGAFYLLVENMPIKYRSRLSSIFLVALVNAKLISDKDYGMDAGLERIVKALEEFENGVMLPSGKFVFGTLIAVVGDNLGLHAIGGFKQGFTAHRPCRFCSAVLEEVQTMTTENESIMRDSESYKKQCEKVQTSKGKNEALSTEYGINRDSLLNSLKSYHVVGGLPPDIMHDLIEGSLPLTIRKLLRHYLYQREEKLFTLDWLNDAIENFDLGYAEVSSKPSILKKEYIDTNDNSTKLHQSASQTWQLAVILPLIIGPLVDDDDAYYANFLDIVEICRISFSIDIPPWMVGYLKDLIEKYLLDYQSLYGELIPKQHNTLHYPSQILSMGSLVIYMCMRLEAKHRYFKKLVNVIGSYKNIFLTLATKHQMHQAVQWSKSLKHVTKSGPTQLVGEIDCTYKHLLPSKVTKLVTTNWLNFEGNKFQAGECFICVGFNEESGPTFVKVKTIIIYPFIKFVCQKVLTIRRNIYLAAYEIKVLEEICTVIPSDMLLHTVLHAHVVKGNLYIAVKYCAGGELF